MAHPGNELIAQDREAVTMGDVCGEDTSLAKKGMGGQAGSGRRQDQPSVKLMGSVAAGERGVDRAGVGHRADALPRPAGGGSPRIRSVGHNPGGPL